LKIIEVHSHNPLYQRTQKRKGQDTRNLNYVQEKE